MSDDSKLANAKTVLGWVHPGQPGQQPAWTQAQPQPGNPQPAPSAQFAPKTTAFTLPQQAPALFPQQAPAPQHAQPSQQKTVIVQEAFQMPQAAQPAYGQQPPQAYGQQSHQAYSPQAYGQQAQAQQYEQAQAQQYEQAQAQQYEQAQAQQYGQTQQSPYAPPQAAAAYPQAGQYGQPYPQQEPHGQPQYPQAGQYGQPYPQQEPHGQPQYPQAGQYGQYPQAGQYGQYPQAGQYEQQLPHQGQYGHSAQPAYQQAGYAAHGQPAGDLPRARAIEGANATVGVSERVRFIRLTYLHLLGAILAFAGLEYLLFKFEPLVKAISIPLTTFAIGGRWNWAIVLAVFMAVSWVADYFASHSSSRSVQYIGLGIYVIAEALIFVPLLVIVAWKTAEIVAKGGGDPNILRDAALVTLAIFGALTASVFLTKKDFSFLRTGLAIASAGALMLIVLSLAFGFNLGIVFSIAMVLLSAGYILYQTSQIFAHYHTEAYVGAALALFSSIALMFWYVIRILLRMRS